MTFFSPNKMAYVALPKNSRKKYREDIFFKALEKSINHKDHCITYIEINEDDWYLRNYMDYCDTCILETSIKLDVWNEKKEEVIDKYERLFIRLGGCFGFATNSFDCLCIQNPNDVHVYERYNIDATGLPLIPNEMQGCGWIVLMFLAFQVTMFTMVRSFLPRRNICGLDRILIIFYLKKPSRNSKIVKKM